MKSLKPAEKPKVGELQMDSLRSEDLKEEKNVTAPTVIIAVWESLSGSGSDNWLRGVPLSTYRMNPEYLDPDTSIRSVTADLLLRQEPDEDEDEEKDENERDDKEEDDEESGEGYSEVSVEHASISHRQTTVKENHISRASATLGLRE